MTKRKVLTAQKVGKLSKKTVKKVVKSAIKDRNKKEVKKVDFKKIEESVLRHLSAASATAEVPKDGVLFSPGKETHEKESARVEDLKDTIEQMQIKKPMNELFAVIFLLTLGFAMGFYIQYFM